jgi:uncharacterized protein YndB with AHSA1/START domain
VQYIGCVSDTVQRDIEVPVPPEQAWPAVADPRWLGDAGEFDLRPGGEGWVDDEGETHFVLIEEVDKPRRLTYRWATFTDRPSRVEIELTPTPIGTRVTVTETPLSASPRAQLLAA